MMKDFRAVSFESFFNSDLDFQNVEIVKNNLAENQLLTMHATNSEYKIKL